MKTLAERRHIYQIVRQSHAGHQVKLSARELAPSEYEIRTKCSCGWGVLNHVPAGQMFSRTRLTFRAVRAGARHSWAMSSEALAADRETNR